MIRLKQLVLFAAIALALLCYAPHAVHAMGISPVLIEARGLLPGSSVSRTIYLTRSNPAADEKGIVQVLGTAAKYIRLPNNGIVDLPQGSYDTPYHFFIEPGNLGTGEYNAQIQVAPYVGSSSSSTGSGGSRLLTGAQAMIKFDVTTTSTDTYTIGTTTVQPTEEGQILAFSYLLDNLGNVDTRPSQIDVTVHDMRDPAFVYTETIPGSQLPLVKQLSSETDTVTTKAALVAGTYDMGLVFSHGADATTTSRDLKFEVYPRGTLAQKGELDSFTTDKPDYDGGEIVAFNGSFKNTGSIGLNATMDVNVFQGSKRVDVLDTAALYVPAGATMVFQKTYRPTGSGPYSAVGSVTFGPQKTEDMTANFTVTQKIPVWIVLSLLVLLVLVIALILFWIMRKRKPHVPETRTVQAAKPAPPMPPAAAPSRTTPTTPTSGDDDPAND